MARKPTRKQKRAVKLLSDNVGMSVGEAMRQAGYSELTAENPDHLTKAKGFAELVEEYLPDWRLAEVHAAGLDAVKTTRDKYGEKYEDPDYYVRHAYLETAYKIKSRLNPAKIESTQPITVNLIMYGEKENASREVKIVQPTLSQQTSRTQSQVEQGMDNQKSASEITANSSRFRE